MDIAWYRYCRWTAARILVIDHLHRYKLCEDQIFYVLTTKYLWIIDEARSNHSFFRPFTLLLFIFIWPLIQLYSTQFLNLIHHYYIYTHNSSISPANASLFIPSLYSATNIICKFSQINNHPGTPYHRKGGFMVMIMWRVGHFIIIWVAMRQ